MKRVLFGALLILLALPLPLRGEDEKDTDQTGETYSPTMGWIKTSSAQLNPVTDYYQASNKHKTQAQAAEKAEAEAKRVRALARKPHKKPRVLVA